jgi:DNA mismatch repair protein MutL
VSYTNRYACQTVSVNGRWVRGTALTRAIDDAYRGTLPAGRYSPVVLMIEIDQRKIDVNVHPTKQVVRFSDEPGVRRAVADAISLAIGSIQQPEPEQAAPAGDSDATGAASGATPVSGGQDTLDSRPAAGDPQGSCQHQEQSQGRPQRGRQERENSHKIDAFQRRVRDASEPMRSPPGPAARAPGGTPGADGNGSGMDSARTGPASSPQQARPEGSERGSLPGPAARVIGQFECGYILLEEPGALWIVDQHAAHERVLLDRLSAGEQVSVQQLLAPEVVELSATEAAEGRELLEELSVYGFEAEPFGPSSFRITGVISTLAERDIVGAFRRAITVARGTESGPDRERQLLATVACKSAVKLGDRLSQQEMESLMKQWLTQSELQATCPHGRSICYRLDSKEVARKLDRH